MTTPKASRKQDLNIPYELRGRRAATQNHLFDRLHDAVRTLQHLVVPKPQNVKALTLRPRRAHCIEFGPPGVLPAIHLDDELAGETHEVDDVGADRRLTPELKAVDLSCPQAPPKPALGFGRIASERPGAFRDHGASLARRDAFGAPPS